MNRLQKINFLRRFQSGEAGLLDMESFVLIFSDPELPETSRKYFILRNNKPVEVSITVIDRIRTQKIFLDLQDINL